jgi:hypothetical protein
MENNMSSNPAEQQLQPPTMTETPAPELGVGVAEVKLGEPPKTEPLVVPTEGVKPEPGFDGLNTAKLTGANNDGLEMAPKSPVDVASNAGEVPPLGLTTPAESAAVGVETPSAPVSPMGISNPVVGESTLYGEPLNVTQVNSPEPTPGVNSMMGGDNPQDLLDKAAGIIGTPRISSEEVPTDKALKAAQAQIAAEEAANQVKAPVPVEVGQDSEQSSIIEITSRIADDFRELGKALSKTPQQ